MKTEGYEITFLWKRDDLHSNPLRQGPSIYEYSTQLQKIDTLN
jgi:hypothetical protein